MSLDQGQTDPAASVVPRQRTPVEFDPESNGLRIGPYERRIADPSDADQVFGAYISLLYAVRGAQPGEQLKLRAADLEALLLIVGDDPETIEQRLIALMGCSVQEARVLGGALLRHRRLTATLGIAGALALGGSIAGDDLFGGSSSDAPRAAVVQSVADGLRALDDAGASRGSVAAVTPASVAMPTDDWTGSKPVGGTPDVPAGTPGEGGVAPADVAPAGQAPSAGDVPAGTPADPSAGSGDVPAGTPAAPAAAAPAVEVPAAVPAAEAPAVAPPADLVVPGDTTTSVETAPADTTPPVVTTPADPTTPVVDVVVDDGIAPGSDGPVVPGTGTAPGLGGELPPGAEHVPDGVTAPGLGGALPDGAAAAPGTSNAPGLGGTSPGGGNGMPGAIDVLPGVPLVLPVVVTPPPPPVVVTPVVVTPVADPTVHDNRDKLKNSNNGNDGDDVDRDDNGKHGQDGQHVENGNGNSNSAGGVVP